MKKRVLSIVFISLLLIGGFYPYRYLKTRYIIKDYYSQPRWTDLKKTFSKFKHNGYTFLFFGDSMTENFQRYVRKNDSIVNMGISGDFTEGLLARADDVVRFKPNYLFIMIGVNDIVEKVPLSEIENNYEELINVFQTNIPNTKIIIQSTLPTYHRKSLLSSSADINTTVQKLNLFLAEMAKNKNIDFIDMYSSFSDDANELKRELTTDGIHLNKDGYAIWKSYLKQYVKL